MMCKNKKVNLIGPCALDSSIIDHYLKTIFVDGGLNHNLNIKDSISIGDGDSSLTHLDHILPQEKDRSDLYHALSMICDDVLELKLHGFIGGRLDHQMIVLSELYQHFLENNLRHTAHLYERDKLKISLLNSGDHSLHHQGLFSLLSFKTNTLLLKGEVKYEITEEYPNNFPELSSFGLSNIASGSFNLKCSSPLIIFYIA